MDAAPDPLQSARRERISSTELGPLRISPDGHTVAASFPVSPRALTFVGDRATGDVLSFKIEIAALLRVLRTAEGAPRSTGGHRSFD